MPENREQVWEFLKEYYNSDEEFELRFLSVMLLWHFTTDEYTDESLRILANIHHTGYYAKMGGFGNFPVLYLSAR